MSNCIKFDNDELQIPDTLIDLAAFREMVESAKGQQPPFPKGDESDDVIRRWYAWWFLIANTEFTEHEVTIIFGNGNSGHTWRDFDGLLHHCITPFMKRRIVVTFPLREEGDNFRTVENYTVNIG